MKQKPIKIAHIVTIGDSLTDRGTLDKRYLFGFVPMGWVSGLSSYSPIGRFTNGLAWSDHFSAIIANELTIEELRKKSAKKKSEIPDKAQDDFDISYHHDKEKGKEKDNEKEKGMDDSAIVDAVISQDPDVLAHVRGHYTLGDDLAVRYKSQDLVRNYNEGGLTAHSYSWRPSKSISRFFSRLILSNLDEKREKLLAYDADHKERITPEHKKETLVVEWSGANDLITVNEKPSMEEVEKAVEERIKNVKKLIENGYRNFELFNLPMLSFTPRYQNDRTQEERDEADRCCQHFNTLLKERCESLEKDYPACSIGVFDVNETFENIYNHPAKYDFDENKKKTPFIKSEDFEIKEDGTSPSDKYMFWDDVHPTADMHALLAQAFSKYCKDKYAFSKPEAPDKAIETNAISLCRQFREKYSELLNKDNNGIMGFFRHSNLKIKTPKTEKQAEAVLKEILQHGLYEGNNRTRNALIQLEWIDKDGCLGNIDKLIHAKRDLDLQKHKEEMEAYRTSLTSKR